MNAKIHPAFAIVAVLCVLAAVGFVFYKANEDKPIPDTLNARLQVPRAPAGAGDKKASPKPGGPGADKTKAPDAKGARGTDAGKDAGKS